MATCTNPTVRVRTPSSPANAESTHSSTSIGDESASASIEASTNIKSNLHRQVRGYPFKQPAGLQPDDHDMMHCTRRTTDEIKYSLLNNDNVVTGTFDCNGGVLTNEDGVKIHIPKGAIVDGDLVTCYTVVNMYGPFVLSSQSRTDLVSPYYWIGVTGSYHFQKPVQVEFEHYAVVTACDPSHYQLLCCEDDDESYTMRPVDYELNFTVQDDKSYCNFKTNHFCSYCLQHEHKCKAPITRIGAFYLKPEYNRNSFTIEIWFSFASRHCLRRNEECYKKRGMILADSYLFEASCDSSSTSYFELGYMQNNNGWSMDLSKTIDLRIETRKANFHNYYTDFSDLYHHEELELYPPRFIINVKNTQHEYTTTTCLDTNINIALHNDTKEHLIKFNLYIPAATTMKDPVVALTESSVPSRIVGNHSCDENKPDIKDLIKFSESLAHDWTSVAVYLGITSERISIINVDHLSSIKDRCFAMFTTWLKKTLSPCWCQFIHALYEVGLNSVAEQAKTHLKLCKSVASDIIDTKPHLESCEKVVAPSDVSKGCSDNPNLRDLTRYFRRIPDEDMDYFICCLLPGKCAAEVIKDIKCSRNNISKEGVIKKICEAFLTEKNPSWTKVHSALKEAECDELADIVDATFLYNYT